MTEISFTPSPPIMQEKDESRDGEKKFSKIQTHYLLLKTYHLRKREITLNISTEISIFIELSVTILNVLVT